MDYYYYSYGFSLLSTSGSVCTRLTTRGRSAVEKSQEANGDAVSSRGGESEKRTELVEQKR